VAATEREERPSICSRGFPFLSLVKHWLEQAIEARGDGEGGFVETGASLTEGPTTDQSGEGPLYSPALYSVGGTEPTGGYV